MSFARRDAERDQGGAQVGHVAGLLDAVRSEIPGAHPVAVREGPGDGGLALDVGGGPRGAVQDLQDQVRVGPMGRSPVPR